MTSSVPLVVDAGNFKEYVRLYAANPLFRAATFNDRVIEDDPYRRPVRPDDLTWIDYGTPVTRPNAQQLSSLTGHRMLLNIYDTRRVLLPAKVTEERRHEHELFYSDRNTLLGEAIRPFLEQHVFSFADAEAADRGRETGADAGSGIAALRGALDELRRTRRDAAGRLAGVVSGSPDPGRAATTVAIQLLAQALNGPARLLPESTELPGGPPVRPPAIAARGPVEEALRVLFAAAGLRTEPHAYYQFYLPSTFGLMNYLNATAHTAGRVFHHLGALTAHTVNAHALVDRLPEIARAFDAPAPAAGEPAGGTADAVPFAVERWGEDAVREFAHGVHAYAVLLEVHDHDVHAQLSWVDSADACKEKAARLHQAITEHDIPVELDTFEESAWEASTTHVHDEDRLQIIDSGEMEFYTAFEGTHRFTAGSMMFVPKHRLHGSVVTAGHCSYHQPVITPELDARFGGSYPGLA